MFGDAEDVTAWFARRERLNGSWSPPLAIAVRTLPAFNGGVSCTCNCGLDKDCGASRPRPHRTQLTWKLRLTAMFCEWLMGLDDGHVTDTWYLPRRGYAPAR